jgi:hypothetical protein
LAESLIQLAHQTSLATRNVVAVQNAFHSRPVQRADRLPGHCLGFFQVPFSDQPPSLFDVGAGRRPKVLVTRPPPRILPHLFHRRLGVWQLAFPPEQFSSPRANDWPHSRVLYTTFQKMSNSSSPNPTTGGAYLISRQAAKSAKSFYNVLHSRVFPLAALRLGFILPTL